MEQGRGARRRHHNIVAGFACVAGAATVLAGGNKARPAASPIHTTLRIGVGQASATNPLAGIRQLTQLLTIESLARAGDDGRMQPWLAASWSLSADSRQLTVKLRHGVKFTDDKPFDSRTAATLLLEAVKANVGASFDDIELAEPSGPDEIRVTFRRPSV